MKAKFLVATSAAAASIIVNYSEHSEDGDATDKAIVLFHSASALFSDCYLAKTGEGAEYDGELSLTGFGDLIGGTCL